MGMRLPGWVSNDVGKAALDPAEIQAADQDDNNRDGTGDDQSIKIERPAKGGCPRPSRVQTSRKPIAQPCFERRQGTPPYRWVGSIRGLKRDHDSVIILGMIFAWALTGNHVARILILAT